MDRQYPIKCWRPCSQHLRVIPSVASTSCPSPGGVSDLLIPVLILVLELQPGNELSEALPKCMFAPIRVVSQFSRECCLPAHRVGPASLPAKTTGAEAGPTHDVNESSHRARRKKRVTAFKKNCTNALPPWRAPAGQPAVAPKRSLRLILLVR
jgi:hypothetical protein